MTVTPVPPVAVSPVALSPLPAHLPAAAPAPVAPVSAPAAHAPSFASLLSEGFDRVNADAMNADKMVRAFVLDDSVPVHQVTYALSQAQLSLDLMLQIRSRLIDAYQQLMNMQM